MLPVERGVEIHQQTFYKPLVVQGSARSAVGNVECLGLGSFKKPPVWEERWISKVLETQEGPAH